MTTITLEEIDRRLAAAKDEVIDAVEAKRDADVRVQQAWNDLMSIRIQRRTIEAALD